MGKRNQRVQLPEVELPMHLVSEMAEELVIGNIVKPAGDRWSEFGRQLLDSDFAIHTHQVIYRAAVEVADSGASPNLSTIAHRLVETGKLAAVGGVSRLCDLSNHPELRPIEPWLRSLRSRAVDREVYRVTHLMALQATQGFSNNSDEIVKTQHRLNALEASLLHVSADAGTLGDAIEAEGGLDALFAKPKGVLPTPFESLTRLTNGGFQRGHLWLLGARPSLGKSTVGLQAALSAARSGRRTAFFSLEMPRNELLKRAISAVGGVPHGALVRGDLGPAERSLVRQTANEIQRIPLEIHADKHDLSQIIGTLSNTKRGRYEFAVIDYLGLVQVNGRFENRVQELSFLSRRLKLAALEQELPILALSQLSRASDVENRRPQLPDLRDSGSLEQDADTILLLHAPGAMKRGQEAAPKSKTDLIIAKQRNGPRDVTVYLDFDFQHCRLRELTAEREVA